MALADLNPRSTLKFLANEDLADAAGKLLTINVTDSATNGVATLELATSATDVPVGIVVVGAASDSGSYPGYATSCEIYDSLIGCFDGALAGGTITCGAAVEVDATGRFIVATPSAGDFIIGFAMTAAAAGEQFTIKFAVTKF
jgi:hypothetical protein